MTSNTSPSCKFSTKSPNCSLCHSRWNRCCLMFSTSLTYWFMRSSNVPHVVILSNSEHCLPSLLWSSNISGNTSSSSIELIPFNNHGCILTSHRVLCSTSHIVFMTLSVDLALMHFTPFVVSDVHTN